MTNMPWEPSEQAVTSAPLTARQEVLAGDRALIRKLGPSGPRGFTILAEYEGRGAGLRDAREVERLAAGRGGGE